MLASASPRRRALLASAGLQFEVISADIDETPLPGEQPTDMVIRLAVAKARAVASDQQDDSWVLGADTIVVLDDQVLGKPKDAADARRTLSKLSGRLHRVVTGFAWLQGDRESTSSAQTLVQFRPIAESVIDAYIATGEPLDKAGSYAIQGRGAKFVQRIEGSYTNVVGLPLVEVLAELQRLGGPAL